MSNDTNPVNAKPDFRAKDMELYNRWKESGSKRDMSALVSHLSPLIYTEVSRASGTLPVAALQAEAKIWTAKGIKSYDPSKGVALGSHITNYLQRVRRLNYKYQNFARIPENQALDYHEFNKAKSLLEEELNRDPTDEELAKKLGWSKAQTIRLKKNLYEDHIESFNERPTEHTQYSDRGILMSELMSRLSDREKFILENKKYLSASELAAKLNINQNRLNYEQKKLVDKIGQLKLELGL
jgi:DNA-directed RNA polymerase specialized sigma subunit